MPLPRASSRFIANVMIFLRGDAVVPVIRYCVRAKVNEHPSCKLALDNVRAPIPEHGKMAPPVWIA